MELFLTVVIAALCGVVLGIFSGLLGIGGGTLMVPTFRLAFGMSALASTATSLFAIIPTALAGAISHVRNKTCILPIGIAAGIGGACTSPIGVWLASISQPWMIMLAAALVIGYSACNMLIKAVRMGKDSAKITSAPEQEHFGTKQVLIAAAIGVLAGVVSGYVGVGGGFIMVPVMLAWLHIPMRKASGTSLVAVALLAIPGMIEHAIMGNIDFFVGSAVALGSIPGAIIGAQLVLKVPERVLRFMFGGFLIVAAILLVLNETGVFGA